MREQMRRFQDELSAAREGPAARTEHTAQPQASAALGAAQTPPPPATAGPGGATPGTPLEEMTKAELYQLAQQRDVKGRTGMSKDELVAALR
ncbi:MAG: Rho termination factor N-terminal domain-containing protein [Actinobacteria bacterium]|nr:Rho termination factor N-terminal domain-containing protein [Actinomycetota bacterium]